MDSIWTPRNITSRDGLCYEAINSPILHIFFVCQNDYHAIQKNVITKKEWI